MSNYDATSSWSGYQYQGKVAIYKVLSIINNLICQNKESEVNEFEFELESLEDFCILQNNKYISSHQVKAYTNSKKINDYFDAILSIYQNKENTEYYLHVISKIDNWSISGINETINTKIENINKKISKLPADKVKEKKELETIRGKNSDLLLKTSDIMKKVKLYPYDPGKCYCSLTEIEGVIKEEIKKYYISTKKEEYTGSDMISRCYINLLGRIDDHVRDRHLKKAKKRIEFSEIIDIMNDDLSIKDERYHIYVIKEIFHGIEKDNYCLKCKRECTNSEDKCSLLHFIDDANNMDLEKFGDFIHKINPHIIWEEIDEFSRYNYLQKNGIQSLFYTIVNVARLYEIEKEKITYKTTEGVYMPTCIAANGEFPESEAEEYCKIMCQNNFILTELYETNIFLTKDINVDNIFDVFKNVEETDESLSEEVLENNKYDIFSMKVSLKDKKDGMEEINNA